MEKQIYEGCRILLDVCAECKKDENILIVTDPSSLTIAQALWNAAEGYPNKTLIMMPTQTMHGQEPTPLVSAAMLKADVILRPTTFSISNTQARRDACANGARDLNCSDYDLRMLSSGGLFADFEAIGPVLDKMSVLMEGNEIEITTDIGTHITASIAGRKSYPQYGRSIKPGQLSSPPDIECAIGANDDTLNGVVYIDGSIPHNRLGLIKEPIRIEIKNSTVVDISGGEEAKTLQEVLASFNDPLVYHVGEIGVGMNPACELTGRMLEDEGCYSTMHFGFGNDIGFDGFCDCPFHLDLVFCAPTFSVDGKVLMRDGELSFETVK